MKIIDVLNLDQTIDQLQDIKHMQFAYALMKNKKIIVEEKGLLSKAMVPIDSYKEFVDKVTALLKEYCDLKNKPNVLTTDELVFLEDKDAKEFYDKLESLHKEYQDQILERRKQLNEYNEFLQQDVDINLYKLKQINLPEDLSFEDLFLLSSIITFSHTPDKEIELSNFEILTYLDLFNKTISFAQCRDKLLHNASIIKQVSTELLNTEVIKAWTNFERERKALAERHSKTDVYGEVLVYGAKDRTGNQFAIKDKEAFDKDLAELNIKYEKELKDFYSFLQEKTKIDIVGISQEDLPSDLSFKDLKSLELFII